MGTSATASKKATTKKAAPKAAQSKNSEPKQSELNQMTDMERAVKVGQDTAKENLKAEQARSTTAAGYDREEIVEDAQETAKLNRKADLKNNEGLEENQIPKNNTSKSAKEATAKAQLDPTGNDPISDEEVKRSATNASMKTGNKTAVDNKEAAKRATRPGKAEEENSFSLAGKKGVTQDLQSSEVKKTGDESTSNKNPEGGSSKPNSADKS